MELIYIFFKWLILPPGSLLALLGAGLACLILGRRRPAVILISLGIAVFYALSVPAVSNRLMRFIEAPPTPESTLASAGAEAIVVLSGGFERYAPEYGADGTVDGLTLQRLRYGVHLARKLDLPILVSGGRPADAPVSLAAMMKAALEQDFGVPVRWSEDKSRDTYENAAFSARLLREDGVRRIILVTHASHMARAAKAFEAAGLEVVAAPTVFAPPESVDLLPRLSSLYDSYYALYEMAGAVWYGLRR
ncbi:MAG: YdcF family protein [Rhodospirillaceae bacterium]|nr:YdcF family protein [Rhodospirillaceae bacterium]